MDFSAPKSLIPSDVGLAGPLLNGRSVWKETVSLSLGRDCRLPYGMVDTIGNDTGMYSKRRAYKSALFDSFALPCFLTAGHRRSPTKHSGKLSGDGPVMPRFEEIRVDDYHHEICRPSS